MGLFAPSIEYIVAHNQGFWRITGPRAVLMTVRIIPWTSPHDGIVDVPDNFSNMEHLEWLMLRYPLEDHTKGMWQKRLVETNQTRKLGAKLKILERAEAPSTFKGQLLDFQKQGLDFLIKSDGNALLLDEMGLGKTIMTLAFISAKESLPAVVVCPLVTMINWQREITKFLHINGKDPSTLLIRTGKPSELPPSDFYIINYDLVAKRRDDLANTGFKTLVMDEIHNLRSGKTHRYGAFTELVQTATLKHKIGLSGTPIYNHGPEIWYIANLIRSGLLGTYSEFTETYCKVDYRGRHIVEESKRDTLREELQRYIMLRRKKVDVLTQLPPKIQYTEIIEADMSKYKRALKEILEKAEADTAKTAFEKHAKLQRAKQDERQVAGMSKAYKVSDFVKNIMEIDESVVVFCHHHAVHDILHNQLREFDPCTIIGEQSMKERQENIDKFQSGKSRLLIAGLRAGNQGISLTRANYVVHAELDWTPSIHRQAEDRLHRIGQENRVFSYYLVARGTLDEIVVKVLVNKTLEIDTILDGGTPVNDDDELAEKILAEIKARVNLH